MKSKDELRYEVEKVLLKAIINYDLPNELIDETKIKFDLTGKAAGQFRCIQRRHLGSITLTDPVLRFNLEAIANDYNDFIHDTIPHEVAHLVINFSPKFDDRAHGKQWKRVCIDLGGSGNPTHKMNLSAGRNMKEYEYVASCGTKVTVSAVRHNKIMRGKVYRLRATRGMIDCTCDHERVK